MGGRRRRPPHNVFQILLFGILATHAIKLRKKWHPKNIPAFRSSFRNPSTRSPKIAEKVAPQDYSCFCLAQLSTHALKLRKKWHLTDINSCSVMLTNVLKYC